MKKNTTPTISLEGIPGDFIYCFADECPRSQECLRYAAGWSLPLKPATGYSVYPQSYLSKPLCPYFYKLRTVSLAWGLEPLFKDVKLRDAAPLRRRIAAFLGSQSTYYRYNRGERTLTPEQQETILNYFAELGYDTSELRFGHYKEGIDFNTPGIESQETKLPAQET